MKRFQDYLYIWAETLTQFAVEEKLKVAIFSEISFDIENKYITKLNKIY